MEEWLDSHPDALATYIRRSRIPHSFTLPDGRFLWANPAWEQMLDYSVVELQEISWRAVTASQSDAEYDSRMAKDLASEEPTRTSYEFRKSYLRKNGTPVPVVIHVQRFPETGPFRFFIVTSLPEPPVIEVVKQEFREMRKEHAEREANRLSVRFMELAQKYPKVAMMVTGFILFLFFGEEATQYLREIAKIFLNGG